jgi:preprotein translocase subunit YajC
MMTNNEILIAGIVLVILVVLVFFYLQYKQKKQNRFVCRLIHEKNDYLIQKRNENS